jgi:hypothetical protein
MVAMAPKKPPAKPLAKPYIPRYVSPQEKAENRARYRRFFYWALVTIPLIVTLVLLGYSSSAPLWLSRITIGLDALFGFPVLWLLRTIAP